MIKREEVSIEKKGSAYAEGLPHILPEPLVTQVLDLCLCVGGGCGDRRLRIVALFPKLMLSTDN